MEELNFLKTIANIGKNDKIKLIFIQEQIKFQYPKNLRKISKS